MRDLLRRRVPEGACVEQAPPGRASPQLVHLQMGTLSQRESGAGCRWGRRLKLWGAGVMGVEQDFGGQLVFGEAMVGGVVLWLRDMEEMM